MLKTVVKEMLRTWTTVFARTTPTDGVDVSQSDTERATQMGNLQHFSSPSSQLSADSVRNAVHHQAVIKRDGWFLSCIICINILILGCALVSGSAFNSVAITAVHWQVFVIIILILTMIWMVTYAALTCRRNQTVLFKDSHAGPVWLRVGLLVFGLLSLLMDIFKIANFVGYLHCDSAVKVALPVVQAVFLFVQTYFLWIHAKDCVQQYTVFSRCGLTLTLSTNLVVWMAAVTEESVHHTEIPHLSTHMSYKSYRASHGDTKCKCSHSACDTFKEAFYYLYPFNIEYSLFASAMAYVMWKNVGRIVEDHGHHKAKFHLKDVFVGPVAGLLVAIIGLITFILYELDIESDNKEKKDKALLMHFAVNIVIVSLMSVCTVIGCVVYRLDRREQMSEKNPTRNLDVGLLVGASMGQIVISYFTIVAVVATGAKGYMNALNLTLAVVVVVQLGLQNYFIIEGLHREPYHVMQEATSQNNCPTSQEHGDVNVPVDNSSDLNSSSKKPNWKRKVLKEVCAFLLLANVIMWIMPAFGARPQFDHHVEMHFYKYTMWTTIVNIGLPFGIFYRMHCIASLFEVYMIS